ncbi:SAM-dependent methyltransferase [Streptomyces odontomachi]|uniref:SAM-dependent methyltransferase n=1 Tax=Streptomyces odontomachi TaxID=2944940 RepID=UPI00210EF1F3|nr:SAM-dependent methyltransferase [Streptomyces sp. ODS25]
MTGVEPSAQRIDTSKPHPARVYDWMLDGKDNYPVDEELGRQMLTLSPHAKQGAKDNRHFMRRAIRWLTGPAGIRQFLDIGTGIPTEPNLHQIAQTIAPETRVVYVDNDPIVLAHAGALLKSTPEGVTEYIEADVRTPDSIISQAREILDFRKPIAVSLVALLHFVTDEDGAIEHVRTLVDALPSGSYLVLTQLTADLYGDSMQRAVDIYSAGGITLVLRSRADVEGIISGLELVDPGIVLLDEWHPELGDEQRPDIDRAAIYALVARKP